MKPIQIKKYMTDKQMTTKSKMTKLTWQIERWRKDHVSWPESN